LRRWTRRYSSQRDEFYHAKQIVIAGGLCENGSESRQGPNKIISAIRSVLSSLRACSPLHPHPTVGHLCTVAQIFNLPYRRFVIGKVPVTPRSLDFAGDPQVTNLRYSRLQVCATRVGNTVNRYTVGTVDSLPVVPDGLSNSRKKPREDARQPRLWQNWFSNWQCRASAATQVNLDSARETSSATTRRKYSL
jgi:hypothetical protein